MEKKNAGHRRPMGWMTERNAATTIVTPGGNKVYKNIHPEPKKVEVTAAVLLADYFGMDAQMLNTAEYKTPDVKIGREVWEIKSLRGWSKNTVEHALARAKSQSDNVVIDARKINVPISQVRSRILYQWMKFRTIRRIVVIGAKNKVEELSRSNMRSSKNRRKSRS